MATGIRFNGAGRPGTLCGGPLNRAGDGATTVGRRRLNLRRGDDAQSSRWVRSMRSWRSCASIDRVAIGPGLEALQRNRLAGLLAKAVGAVLDPNQRFVDLRDQLALAGRGCGAPRRGRFSSEGPGRRYPASDRLSSWRVAQGLVGFPQELALPAEAAFCRKYSSCIGFMKGSFLGGMVVGRKQRFHAVLDWMIQLRIFCCYPGRRARGV